MQQRSGQLDEAFLSHTHACMRKAADDSLNGALTVVPAGKKQADRQGIHISTWGSAIGSPLTASFLTFSVSLADFVQVLQKVLQLYAGFALTADSQSGSQAQLDDLIAADVESWPTKLRDAAGPGGMSEAAFTEALQRRMEGTILSLKSGSYAQQVQVRFFIGTSLNAHRRLSQYSLIVLILNTSVESFCCGTSQIWL